MSRKDASKPLDGGTAADAETEPPRDAASSIPEHIGRQLRAMFEDVVAQPVPETLRRLLEELERKQRKS
jgi:hypothetical protein